ncbi:hypothetical protein SHL15_9133 [Streptomyces hygroscopicus subsp. limoneus]|nr:hypothetical protein SHL15_9133 [Streptomyces hygroscopicus subsp. limoneus]
MRLPRRAGSLLPQINPSQVVPTLPNADEPVEPTAASTELTKSPVQADALPSRTAGRRFRSSAAPLRAHLRKTSKRLRRECAKGFAYKFAYKVGSAVAMVACAHIAFVPALNPGTAMHGVHNTGDLPVHRSRR